MEFRIVATRRVFRYTRIYHYACSLSIHLYRKISLPSLTPEANRAARAILKWSIRDLANEAGVAFSTVHLFEKTGKASDATIAKIIDAFARFSVEITNGVGTGARLLFPENSEDDLAEKP